MKYQILPGDNRDTLKTIADNSIDAIVTDPPYGIDFLGKDWDANTGALETYQECLRVLKPGGHILAFSAARTYHHLAITLEQAGFEIRDQIMWIYSSGFPKSQDIGKSIDRQSGQAAHKAELAEVKTILKQLYSDSGKSTAEISRECGFNAGGYLKTDFKDRGWANNLPRDDKWLILKSVLGCGDEYDDYFITTPQIKVGEKLSGCFSDEQRYTIGASGASVVDITQSQTQDGQKWSGWGTQLKPAHEPIALARKPIRLSIARNCQTHGVGALNIDATRIPHTDNLIGGVGNKATHKNFSAENQDKESTEIVIWEGNEQGRFPANVIGEIPLYQKYFYCPKVSRSERHIDGVVENNHPTVKPIELMKYLIRLITPPDGHVLDPFTGSGSTGCAAVELGMEYTGCELDPAYVDIAHKRIQAWNQLTNPTTFQALFSAE